MATTYISKIKQIGGNDIYTIKDAEAQSRLDVLEAAGYVTSSGVTEVTAGAGLNTTSNDTATDGGTITTTGTLYLTKSGVTANTYGNTSQQTPAHGGTFNIPYFTVDKYGRITSASTTTVQLPADNNTDTLVTQTNQASTNADYRILLSGTDNDTTTTETANKNTNLRFNPSTQTLSVGGNITASGNLSVTGTSTLSGETSAQSLTAGSLLVNGNANFVQIPTAPTPATGSNDTSIATTAFVKSNLGSLSGAMHLKGTTTTAMSDGLATAAVTIGGSSYTPEAGDVVLYSDSEFVWTGSAWERLGRDSSFKITQTAVTDTAYSGTDTSTTFVTAVTQNANGEITVTKRNLPTYTDTKVTQNAAITTNGDFPLLLSKTSNTTVETDTVNKQSTLVYNPSTTVLNLNSGDNKKGAIYLTSPSHTFGLLNGSGGTNYGIYDNTSGNTKWVLVDDSTHNWRVKAAAERVDYLVSPTAAGTAAKTVTTAEGGPANFTLTTGTSIYIKFSDTNTANNPTLNISGSGAKAIYYKGVRVLYQGLADTFIYHMVYDGTNWVIVNEIQARVGTSSTGASTAEKKVTCPGFVLCANNVAYVKFSNTNSHATPTLNINSTGAKAIIFQGATTTHAYRILRTGVTYVFRYNGSQYEFLEDNFYHAYVRGVSAVAATYYTQQDYDDYVAANGEPPSWNVGDEKTAAVAATSGYESLILGNSTTSNTNNGMNGQLALYGTGSGYHTIKTALTGNTSRSIYIPNYGGDGYLTHTASASAVGNNTQPVYVAANGRITAIGYTIATNVPSGAVFTDTKQNVTLGTTTKAYVTGVSTTPTSTAQALTAIADTGVYLDTTAGQLAATSFKVVGSANSSNIISSDATTNIYAKVNNKVTFVVTDTTVRPGNNSNSAGVTDLGTDAIRWNNVYANKYYGDGTSLTLPTTYWANLATTSAAAYNTIPEVAKIKINGDTAAAAAATASVTLVYDTTNQALNFVFA